MNFSSVTGFADSRTVESSPHLDPRSAYLDYLVAVERRDIAAVIAAMTDDCGRQLRELRRVRDFGPTFDLWCESQRENGDIVACAIDGCIAHLDLHHRAARTRVELHWVEGGWRIASERHMAASSDETSP